MTKEEKIQEAYGVKWENVKDAVDYNGYIPYWYYSHFKIQDCDLKVNGGSSMYRPKSLKGIENNNGWINPLISGLPQKKCNVYFIKSSDNETKAEEHIGYWNNKLGHFFSYDNSEKYLFDEITHYQPIIKPQPPIY